MSWAADIAREQDEGLKQLFQAGLELSLQAQANAMAAEPEAQARLALSFHRLARGVRQTAALRIKLAREAERAGREAAAELVVFEKARAERRKAQVKAAVERLIWHEYERLDDPEYSKTELEDLLEIEVIDADAFLAEPAEVQLARICEALRLPSPLAGQDPPPQGEVSAKPTEGVAAHEPSNHPASQPPQSLRDSSPSGGASVIPDHPFRSSG